MTRTGLPGLPPPRDAVLWADLHGRGHGDPRRFRTDPLCQRVITGIALLIRCRYYHGYNSLSSVGWTVRDKEFFVFPQENPMPA